MHPFDYEALDKTNMQRPREGTTTKTEVPSPFLASLILSFIASKIQL